MTNAERNSKDRLFFLKRALMHAMNDFGGYPIRQDTMITAAAVKADDYRPTEQEFVEQLNAIRADGLADLKSTERGHVWKLSVSGQFWITQNP